MIEVTAIHAFTDNYIWLITRKSSRQCYLVDPGDGIVCIEELKKRNLELAGVLITHHHPDHTGGLKTLVEYAIENKTDIKIWGPDNPKIKEISHVVKEGDVINLFNSEPFNVIEVPGHTLDHIAYFNDLQLFCGDTLFSGGCGRLFEGTPGQMHASLQKLKQLNGQTKVYCAHEYTQANLKFALAVEPNNEALNDYANQVNAKRQMNLATIPSTIKTELMINPFLRSEQNSVKQQVASHFNQRNLSEIETFAATRSWKDKF